MRRAPVAALRACVRAARVRAACPRRVALAAAALLAAALGAGGCGGEKPAEQAGLGFQFDDATPDSAALAKGRPLLREFEPYRASNGALRVRGRFDLPDGARLQVSVRRRADGRELAREQVVLISGAFDSPPIPGSGDPLPEDDYLFELRTEFNRVWQPDNVLDATRSGLALTGPGVGRGAQGEAIYRMTIEWRL